MHHAPTSFQDKVVLITGGGGGIGKAAARRFLDQGAGWCSAARAPRCSRRPRPSSTRAPSAPRSTRVRSPGAPTAQALVRRAGERFGGVDVLVNSTGIFRPVPFLEQTEEHLEEALGSILRPTFWVSQAAAGAMRERGGGAIVNVGSMWAVDAIATTPTSAYSAAQAGRHVLTKNLAIELAPRAASASTRSRSRSSRRPPTSASCRREEAQEVLESVDGFHPLGRRGQPQDVVEAVLFLAGPDARLDHRHDAARRRRRAGRPRAGAVQPALEAAAA